MLYQHKQGFYEKRVDNHGFSFFPKEDKSKAKGKRKTEKEKGEAPAPDGVGWRFVCG